MRPLGASGVWELFIPGLGEGELYKYEIYDKQGHIRLKTDPYGNFLLTGYVFVPDGALRTIPLAALHDGEDGVDRITATMLDHGVEVRHLRMYKIAAEREAGVLEQLIMPLLKQRNPDARARAGAEGRAAELLVRRETGRRHFDHLFPTC